MQRALTYADARYFNNNRKSARIAHTANDKEFPTPEAAKHAFQAMPDRDEFEKRDLPSSCSLVRVWVRSRRCA